MRFKSILTVAALCMAFLYGCKDYNPEYGAPMSLRMVGVSGYPNLDTELQFGLFVGEPVGIDNEMFTVSNSGRVESKNDFRWKFDQRESSRFFAYSPYDESYSGQEKVTITIPTDQSTPEKMLKGNILTAYASGSPKETAVTLRAKHAMTAIIVTFDNRTGERITSVKAGRFMNVGTLDLVTGATEAVTQTDVITAMRCPGTENSFCFLYIPQDVTPFFEVTLESGKTIGFDIVSDESSRLSQFPGMVVKLKDIQITEATETVNILNGIGASVLPWTTNGIPSMPSGLRYITLKEFKEINPEERSYSFMANLNKVTVTAVDKSDSKAQGLVLEDSTCAIHVWAADSCNLKVGNTVVGPVIGLMTRTADGELYVSDFSTKLATVDKTKVLPSTECSFDTVSARIKEIEYKRMVFRNATLKQGFDDGRAIFEQNGVEMAVVCPDLNGVNLTAGVHGDLTGFPVRSGLDCYIMVYDSEELNRFTKEYEENSLTRSEDYGLYDITNLDTVVYMLNAPDGDFQYSVRYSGNKRIMQVVDTRRFESYLITVYNCKEDPVEGHVYRTVIVRQGKMEPDHWEGQMECVKKFDDTAWFVSKTGKYGLVMLL